MSSTPRRRLYRHDEQRPPARRRQASWEAALAELRVREKAATRELDAIGAQRRRLPMVELPDYVLEGETAPSPWPTSSRASRSSSSTTTCGSRARRGSARAAQASRASSAGSSSSTAGTPASSSSPRAPSTRRSPTRPGSATRWSGTPRPTAPSARTWARPRRRVPGQRVPPRRRHRLPDVQHAGPRHRADRHSFPLIDLLPYGRQEEWQDVPEGWPQYPTYSPGAPLRGLRRAGRRLTRPGNEGWA